MAKSKLRAHEILFITSPVGSEPRLRGRFLFCCQFLSFLMNLIPPPQANTNRNCFLFVPDTRLLLLKAIFQCYPRPSPVVIKLIRRKGSRPLTNLVPWYYANVMSSEVSGVWPCPGCPWDRDHLNSSDIGENRQTTVRESAGEGQAKPSYS